MTPPCPEHTSNVVPGAGSALGGLLAQRLLRLRARVVLRASIACLLFAGSPGAPAEAALTASPPRPRLAVAAGGAAVATVVLRNDGAEPARLDVAVRDWSIDGGTARGLTYHPPGTLERSAAPYIQVLPERLDLPPGGSGEIKVSITLPPEAAGSYFAALLIARRPAAVEDGPGKRLRIGLNYGHLITVDTAGNTTFAAELHSFDASRPDDTGGFTVTTHLTNVGDAGLRPEGSVAILSEEGGLVTKAPIPITFAHPGGDLDIVARFEDVLAPGRYEVIGTIDLGGGRFLAPELTLEVVDALEIAHLSVATVASGSAAAVEVDNPGNVTHRLTGRIEIRDAAGGLVHERETSEPLLALPDRRAAATFDLGDLPAGRYVARVELGDGPVRLEATEALELRAPGAP